MAQTDDPKNQAIRLWDFGPTEGAVATSAEADGELENKRLAQAPLQHRWSSKIRLRRAGYSFSFFSPAAPSLSIGKAVSSFCLALIIRRVSSMILAGLKLGGVERGG